MEFIEYLKSCSKRGGGKFTDKSIAIYCDDVKAFLIAVNKEIGSIIEDDVYQYLLRDSERTALRRFSSLKKFFEFAVEFYLMDRNLCTSELFKRLRRVPDRQTGYISKEDAEHLLEKCKNHPKHYAIIYTYLNTGLREAEVINLSRNIQDGRVRVITKGNVERSIKLNSGTEKAMKEYLATREDNSPYMFVTDSYHNKYSVSGMYKLVKSLMDKAYIEKNNHPHALRHTYANDIYGRTGNIFAVQKLLGHKNIKTTQEYVKTLPNYMEDQIQEECSFNIG
jgi:site-specific recombinase XerD